MDYSNIPHSPNAVLVSEATARFFLSEARKSAHVFPESQRDAGHAYSASQRAEGWIPLADDYDDTAYSGGSMDRPALMRLPAGEPEAAGTPALWVA